MKINFFILSAMLVIFSIYWVFWFPGPRVANDFSLVSLQTVQSQINLPQTWSISGTEGLGEYAVFTLWSYPFSFLNSLFAYFSLSIQVLERILILIPLLIIGVFSIWKLCEHLKLSNYAKLIATIFYLSNTYILLLIDGGQLTISLVYAFFPLAFLLIEKSLEGGFKKRILAGLAVSFIGIFDPRFIFVLAILCLIRFIYGFDGIEWIKKWGKTTSIVLLVYLGLNFYWLYILLKVPVSQVTFASLTQTNFVSFISLGHALLLLSPNWFKNIFGQTIPLRLEFFAIPIFAFLAPILRGKSKELGFWLLVAVIAIFLTKGSSEPLSQIYPWLYANVPGFSLFRDSSKFFFLVALSYSVLIGVTVDEITKRFQKSKLILVGLVLIYIAFLIRPVSMGEMTGTLSNPPLQKEYSQLDSIISNNSDTAKVFWIPTIAPLTSLNSSHPAIEASRLVAKRPFAQAAVGTYEMLNFLREATYMGQLFDVSNIGYIVYPTLDSRREQDSDKIKYYSTFLGQLSNLSWLERIDSSPIPLLKVKQHQDRLFVAHNVWWVIGADNLYQESTKSSELRLSNNALIFTDESPELGNRIDELPKARIILNHKTIMDLAASFLDRNDLIFPAVTLKHDPDSTGWWKRETADLISWKDFLKTKYGINNQDFDLGGGWAVGEGSLQLKVQSSKLKQNQVLLARVLESSRSGTLSFYQEDKLIGQISTKKPESNIRWFEVGNLQSTTDLTIKTLGDINVVNALAVVSKDDWYQFQQKAKKYRIQDGLTDFTKDNTVSEASSVNYKQISATHYVVSVKGVKNSEMLIFSQNFDQNWKLNGQTPYPVYSLLNGYSIQKDGQYDLVFEPQKYVVPAMTVSAITLLLCLILLLV